jgi:hypothetical protein
LVRVIAARRASNLSHCPVITVYCIVVGGH